MLWVSERERVLIHSLVCILVRVFLGHSQGFLDAVLTANTCSLSPALCAHWGKPANVKVLPPSLKPTTLPSVSPLLRVGFHRYQSASRIPFQVHAAVSWLVLIFFNRRKDIHSNFALALFRILTTEISKGFKRCEYRSCDQCPHGLNPARVPF